MRHLLLAPTSKRLVIEAPPYVVVTAQVVKEGVLLGQGADRIELLAQEARIFCGYGMPGSRHGRHVVQHVALRLFNGTEVRNNLDGSHHDLAQQRNPGAHDLSDHTHHAHERMDLRKVAAVGAKLLPDIGNRIEAHDIDALIRQIQEVVHHLVEDAGVPVVEVPLVRVELRHDALPKLGQIGPVTRRRGGEHLRHIARVLVDHLLIGFEEVPAHVLALARPRAAGPFVLFGRMVHHEVHAQAHAPLMTGGGEVRELVHRAEPRLHAAEILYRIAAIGTALVGRGIEERHEVDVVHMATLEIGKLVLDALDGTGEVVDIHLHAEHVLAPVPRALLLAHDIELPERF